MEDEVIIDLYFERAEDAIKETEVKYGGYLEKVIRGIISTREDIEECLNDTYMAAWNSIPPRRPKSLGAYIAGIARNTALNRYDYLTAEKRNPTVEVVLSELEECLSAGNLVEQEVQARSFIKALNSFLRGIGSEKRTIFIRRYWFCDSTREIAVRFGMSEGKVKSMLFRIRKQLLKYLEKEGIAL